METMKSIFAIKSNTRIGYRFYTRESLIKRLSGRTYRLQLINAGDDIVVNESHIFPESDNPSVLLDEIESSKGFGVWSLTEIVSHGQALDTDNMFGAKNDVDYLEVSNEPLF